ncbi:GNAT family N-acetyltransferase [candidate division KSB1 bacterium]|nr:GNAT family N-acetyltransferase [candidate division KSB1 bacterium]
MNNFKIGRIRKNHQNLLELCFHHRELLTYRTLPDLFSHSMRIKELLQQQIEQKMTMSFSIENDDEIAGVALFHNLDFEERQGQLSVLLLAKFESNKLENLLGWMIEHSFNTLNMHRIYGLVRVDKIEFVPIIEKCGFSREAHLSHAAFFNGEYGDMYQYSIVK